VRAPLPSDSDRISPATYSSTALDQKDRRRNRIPTCLHNISRQLTSADQLGANENASHLCRAAPTPDADHPARAEQTDKPTYPLASFSGIIGRR